MKIMKLLFVGILLTTSLTTFAQPTPAVMKTGRQFLIQSAMDYGRDYGGYWDIPGTPQMINKGSNIQVWDLDGGSDRKFTLVNSSEQGYYEIYVADTKGSRVDVAGGKSNDGTNVGVWEVNNGTAQRFLFQHLGNGRFKIFDRNGKVICLASRSNKNGSNIHIWGNHDGVWVEWYLIDAQTKTVFVPTQNQQVAEASLKGTAVPEGKNYIIQSAMSYGRCNDGCWDLPGNNVVQVNSNIQIWTLDNGTDRLFRFEKKRDSEYYQIYAGKTSDGVVDLPGGKTENGNVMQIWTAQDGNHNQDFYLKHLGNGRFKIYHRSGKIINLKNTNNNNGNKVQIWNDHDAIHCEWYLIDPNTKQAYIPGGSTARQEQVVTRNEQTNQTPTNKSSQDLSQIIDRGDQIVIENLFKKITLNNLQQEDGGRLTKAMNSHEVMDQANITFFILNGVKSNEGDVRSYTLNQLKQVEYKKASFLVKALINSYFSKYQESDPGLRENLNELQQKMTK